MASDASSAARGASEAVAHSLDPIDLARRCILKIEEACLSGREPFEEDLGCLQNIVSGHAGPFEGKDLVVLCSFGHRLWHVCASESVASLAIASEARLREAACGLFSLACGSACAAGAKAEEQAIVAPQWALAGRAWVLAGDDHAALRCFAGACSPWEGEKALGATRLAEAAFQAYLWASQAHFRLGAFDKAFCSISSARDAIEASAGLRRVGLEDLLALCGTQAKAHRLAGRSRLGVELLTLALTSLSPLQEMKQDIVGTEPHGVAVDIGSFVRVRLLRHLALCYAHLLQFQLAVSHAQQAFDLGPPGSAEQADSLQVLLSVFCDKQDASYGHVGAPDDVAKSTAFDLMRHPAAMVDDCLGMCSNLLLRKWPVSFIFSCLAELGKRVQGDLRARCEIIRLQLQIAADTTESSVRSKSGEFDDGEGFVASQLGKVVAEARISVDSIGSVAAGLKGAVSSVLWKLGDVAVHFERYKLASRLFEEGIPFVDAPRQLALFWAAIAACHRWAGRFEKCSECADKALALDQGQLHATLLSISSSIETHPDAPDKASALMKHAKDIPDMLPKHIAAVLTSMRQSAVRGAVSTLQNSGLEALSKCLLRVCEQGNSAVVFVKDFLAVTSELMSQVEENNLQTSDMVRHLSLIEQCAAVHGVLLAHDLQQEGADELHIAGPCSSSPSATTRHTGASIRAVLLRRALQVAWVRGQRLGKDGAWAQSAEIFEALTKVFERLDNAREGFAEGSNVGEDAYMHAIGHHQRHAVSRAMIWCLIMVSSARVQLLKASPQGKRELCSDVCGRALRTLERAHQLWRHLSKPQQVGKEEICDGAGDPDVIADRAAFVVLVLLEFEVRCLAGEPELQLKNFVDEASAQEVVGAESLLALAKVAAISASRRLAVHCLQSYLRIFVGVHGAANYSQCAAAYRELIALYASRNESFDVYDGILHLLGNGGGSLGSQQYPKQEVAWLVASAWNNGCHFHRLQQYKWGERWMGKALALLRHCPNVFPEDAMTKGYMECLEQCGE